MDERQTLPEQWRRCECVCVRFYSGVVICLFLRPTAPKVLLSCTMVHKTLAVSDDEGNAPAQAVFTSQRRRLVSTEPHQKLNAGPFTSSVFLHSKGVELAVVHP